MQRYRSPRGGRIDLPGAPAKAGVVSDGLEGFARTFLLAAFRAAGDGDGTALAPYREGLVSGPGPTGPDAWPPIGSHGPGGQPMVESASVALGLLTARRWTWDLLGAAEQDRLEGWLRGALRNEPAPNNWYLFPMAVAAFLDEVGRGDAETARAIDRAHDLLEGWYRGDGWYSDGDGRAFDHYIGWAMHLYPVLVAHLRGDTAQLERLGPRLEEFLGSFAATFDANGASLHQGRSLTYRTAALAAVALGEVVGWTPLRPGQTRRILSAGLRYFLDRGALTDGIFSRGWHGPHAATLQTYSGPASPYWASKGFVGLLLPETAPLWTAVEEPPPSAGPDRTIVIPSVGWLVQTTEADGMVRVHNHGSDHLNPWDADGGDPDPLYARLAYSTRTGPTAVRNAPDNHIALHVRGRESVRRRIHPIGSGPDWVASWHQPQFPGPPAFPGGPPVAGGPVLPQGRIESLVVARGAWEVHAHRLRAVPAGTPVTVTGWALAAATPQELEPQVDSVAVAMRTGETAARLIGCNGFDAAEVQRAPQGTAYGAWALVPTLRGTVVPGELLVSASTLTAAPDSGAPEVEVAGAEVSIGWPDGGRTTCTWTAPTPVVVTTPSHSDIDV
ncbi:uncharacterized protein DUF2264 [Pseudonocardia hierapolitana]|uniref:Uncharacterized protein DUF2264 n=1 Tax=Pseudonocardia hierapolitana TaxID=1128676 RepID=A0A561ST42_9PSEU|nr:uncharacterized protein DUF2264 [Pseudonocardia hierapolitana]